MESVWEVYKSVLGCGENEERCGGVRKIVQGEVWGELWESIWRE